MQLQKLGVMLCLALALALTNGCRDSVPPKIEICIGDGFGGAECQEADGTQLYRTPSMLKNYWATNQPDEANFVSWCYQTTTDQVKPAIEKIDLELAGSLP